MARNYSRPPMSDQQPTPTPRPSLISLGERQIQILEFAANGEQIRRRAFAKRFNLAPTTVYDNLQALCEKELMQKGEGLGGAYTITQKGIEWLKSYKNHGSGSRQGAYRGAVANLSQHALRFEMCVKDRSFFNVADLNKLGTVSVPVDMQNWSYHRVQIGECELRVFTNKIVLYMEEFVDKTVDATQLKAINRALEIAQEMKKIGLVVQGIKLDAAHWARVNSILADALISHLGKYWYQCADGSKFWIDFSGNQLEDETDSNVLRSRVDSFIEDLPKSKAVFSDVDATIIDVKGMKEVMAMMLAHDVNLVRMQNGTFNQVPKDQKNVRDYFG